MGIATLISQRKMLAEPAGNYSTKHSYYRCKLHYRDVIEI